MATYTPTTGAPSGAPSIPLPVSLRAILRVPAASRDTLECIIEQALDVLDLYDGNPDLEDDDPAGDPLDEYGEAATDSGTEMLPLAPTYAVDQSLGPTNEDEAYRAWQRSLYIG